MLSDTPDLTKRSATEKKHAALKTERSSFDSHWMECAAFIQPRKGRFNVTDRNRGDKRWNNIINSRGTQALRIARSGVFNGIMSPTRPWFKLETMDNDMMNYQPVKVWLEICEKIINEVFNQSNLYSMAPTMIGELLLFGTGAMIHEDDYDDVARFYTFTIGSYCIAQDAKHRVDTFYREFQMTTVQMIAEYGLDNVSQAVKNCYDRGDYYNWFTVNHAVEPNQKHDGRSQLSAKKRFRSVYYDPADDKRERYLSEKGYDEFPFRVPRWEVTGEDVYATDCPGMTALGDVKGLQIMERRTAQAIDKAVNPPLHGPSSLKTVTVSSLPGGMTYYDMQGENGELKPIYKVDPNIQGILDKTRSQEMRLNEAFYVDLFQAITNMEGIQPRNEMDLDLRQGEKLTQLGPVLERMIGEILNPTVDKGFTQCLKAGILPPPPPELQGQVLKVRYISSLATAMKSVTTTGIDRLAGFATGLAKGGVPGALDYFNEGEAMKTYGQFSGAPAKVLRSDEEVAQIRQQRAQEAQAAQMAAMAEQGSGAIKNMADAGASMRQGQEGMNGVT